MVSLLFWNLAKNAAILPHIENLARNHDIDIFLFAEAPQHLTQLISNLNGLGSGKYYEAGIEPPKVRVVTRLLKKNLKHRFTTIGRETAIWSLQTQKMNPSEILLAVTHLPAKSGGNDDESQASVAQLVAGEIVEFEDDRNHQNSLIVGDFNMNPYDPGMTIVTGFYGFMTKTLAKKPDRTFRNKTYRRFYNPMWGLFGDRTPGPAGTHYWDSSVPTNPFWAMFDQVLLRPSLIEHLTELTVLDNDGVYPLVNADGIPTKEYLSDHLPVLFRMDI